MPEVHGIVVGSTAYQYDYNDLANKPSALPASSVSDEGKALFVNSTGDPVWDTIQALPPSSASDHGKALMVNNSGTPAWRDVFPPYASDGDIMQYTSGCGVMWVSPGVLFDIPDPSYASEGASLTVVDSEGGMDWINILPDYESAADGACLAVDDGSLTWREIIPSHEDAYDGDCLVVDGCSLTWRQVIPSYSGVPDGACLVAKDCGPGEISWEFLIPRASSYDEGKALVVNSSGIPEWGDVIPDYPLDDGLCLVVNACSPGSIEWRRVLPEYDSDDEGECLRVDDMGRLEWALPAEYSIERQSTAEAGYTATYRLVKTVDGVSTYVGDPINI